MTEVAPDLTVSRETMDRLEIYGQLLRVWNRKINLVAPSTIDDFWSRHVLDSAQLFAFVPSGVDHWADLGSGGGFPGLVIALLAQDTDTPTHVTLVESDARKSTFLRTVIRQTGVTATIITGRAENIAPLNASVVSARALAPLPRLLGFVHRHLSHAGTALLLKGQNWDEELRKAQLRWQFSYRTDKSKLQENSVILSVTGVSRV